MADRAWYRIGDGVYEHALSGVVVERFDPLNTSNTAIWSVRGIPSVNFCTLREAKQFIASQGAPE